MMSPVEFHDGRRWRTRLVLLALATAGCDCAPKTSTQHAQATLEVDPVVVHFDRVPIGTTRTRAVALRNPGNRSLTVTGVSLVTDVGGPFELKSSAPTQLAAGSELTLAVELRPTSAGAQSARLLVVSDADNTPEVEVSMSGVCVETATCEGIVCDAPPPPTCAGSSALTSYGAPGVCEQGDCSYPKVEVACPEGCSAGVCLPDPCAQVVCDRAPACFGAGACLRGACRYSVQTGAGCDDGDPCTGGDLCTKSGECRGSPGACAADASSQDAGVSGGCWLDPATSLEWQVPAAPYLWTNWNDAVSDCAALVLCGHDDWRLPSVDELRGLVQGCAATESNGSCPVHDGGAYSVWSVSACRCSRDAGSSCYWDSALGSQCPRTFWSSSVVPDLVGFVWSVDYTQALVHAVLQYDTSNPGQATRCVRTGP